MNFLFLGKKGTNHKKDISLIAASTAGSLFCPGIPGEDKETIFKKGFGKHTGLGLFLTREILSITSIIIRENGEPENRAQFEIPIPHEMYRKPSD